VAPSKSVDPKFDAIFESLPGSYAEIARGLRDVIRATAPDLREAVKWNNPFWVGRKDVFCLQCYDDHVNFGVMQGAKLAGRFPRIEGTGKAMRHVKVPDLKSVRSPELAKIVRAAVELDRTGD
jgi:hypothetical protein